MTVLHVVPAARGGMRRHVGWLLRSEGACAVSPLRLPAALRRFRPDVVHAHGYRAAALCRLVPVPVVATAHTLPRSRALIRAAGARVHWVAVSRAVAAALGVPAPVLPPVCDPPGPQPDRRAARAALGVGHERLVVAGIGRFAYEKGFDVLVRAMALLPGATLLLAGDGPEGRRLRRLARGVDVRFLGWVDDVDLPLAAADVVAVPSRREGLGLVALEAAARGRPVVATGVGGLPEVAANLVPCDDPEALGRALRGPWREGCVRPGRPRDLRAAMAAIYRQVLA
jgi:glycosyltransferase involved in cell wall biosynthesis